MSPKTRYARCGDVNVAHQVVGDGPLDRVYVPGAKNAINVRESAALRILALARDEAHRASNALREKRGKKRKFKSELDDVPGVGPKTRQKLLTELGSLEAVRRATKEELAKAGATRKQATAIRKALGRPTTESVEAEDQAIENAFLS